MSRRLQLSSAALGALLLVGAPSVWWLTQPADTVGELETTVSAPIPEELDTPAGATGAIPDDDPDREPAVAPPVRVAIGAIGTEAPIVPVGLEPDRSMEIPDDIATVGWYEPGVLPGAPGTAVLAGHVDSRSQGRGAFFDLRHLDVNDVVTVDHADGTTSRWRVVARTSYPKDELPIADIFTRFSDIRLVLITCGGDFDRRADRYTDNVVVYTKPAEDAPDDGPESAA